MAVSAVLLRVELNPDPTEGWLLSREDFETIVRALEAQPATHYRLDFADCWLTVEPVREEE